MTFRQECEEWLVPLGFSVISSSGDGSQLQFVSSPRFDPSISCRIEKSGEKTCELVSAPLKLFILLKTGKMQFKHPDIEKYIRVFHHYSQLCETYPPTLS